MTTSVLVNRLVRYFLRTPADTDSTEGLFVHRQKLEGTLYFKNRLKRLSRLTPWKGYLAIVQDWLLIAALWTVSLHSSNPFLWAGLMVLVATRQHALLILMHDAAHFRMSPDRRWNDGISDLLCAWPHFVSTQGYRDNHLQHHQYLNTDDDPDWTRRKGKSDWQFPMSKSKFFTLLLKDLIGIGLVNQIKAIKDLKRRETNSKPKKSPNHAKIAFYVTAITVIVATGRIAQFVWLWLVPALFILPVIMRVRSVARHFGLEHKDDFTMSRNYIAPLWERILIAPHHVGYHLDHHLYPAVPFYNLKKLHKLLMILPEYRENAHQNSSLFGKHDSVLEDISKKEESHG